MHLHYELLQCTVWQWVVQCGSGWWLLIFTQMSVLNYFGLKINQSRLIDLQLYKVTGVNYSAITPEKAVHVLACAHVNVVLVMPTGTNVPVRQFHLGDVSRWYVNQSLYTEEKKSVASHINIVLGSESTN